MSERVRRLSTVAELKVKAYDEGAAALGRARADEARALVELERVEEQVRVALGSRSKMALAGGSSDDWQGAEGWIHRLREEAQRSSDRVDAARAESERLRARLVYLQSEVDKMQMLLEKIRAEERLSERRVEQRNEDEHSSTRIAIAQSRQGPTSQR